MSRRNELDAAVQERIHDVDIFLSGYAKDPVDALVL
jgi:hypothetical protein